MKKKVVSVVSLMLAMLMLCSCAMPNVSLPWKKEAEADVVLNVSGAEIGADLYAYYLSLILRNPKAYGVEDGKEAAKDKAMQMCVDYAAINSAFADEGLHLSPDYKNQIAENVLTKWGFYKKYYSAVGITKQTVAKYETNEAKRKALMEYKYGKGGAEAVSDVELNAYYDVNYVTFRSANGYLTRSGSGERLSVEEVAAAEKVFKEMCELVRTGSELDTVIENTDSVYVVASEAETITINRKINNYPSEFFTSVQKMEEGAARVIETSDYLFLVVKQSAKSDENYEAHRLLCLLDLCAEPFAKYLQTITDGYTVKKDSAVMREVYNTVAKKFK